MLECPGDPGWFCLATAHESPKSRQNLGIDMGGGRERGPTHRMGNRIATLRSAQHLDHDGRVHDQQASGHATSLSRRPSSTNVTLSGPSLGSGGLARTSSSHSCRVGSVACRRRTSIT